MAIEATMLDLVDMQFSALQTLLEIRAEVNFLSGLSLAMVATRDQAIVSVFSDLATSSNGRLEDALDLLGTSAAGAVVVDDLRAIADTLATATSRGPGTFVDRDMILATRQSADATLSTAVDDMVFDLTIAADDATTANRDTIESLFDTDVAFLTTLLEIKARLGEVVADCNRSGCRRGANG